MGIESVVLLTGPSLRGRGRGASEVPLLELTSQLLGERDLGIAGEPRCRFEACVVSGGERLEHGKHGYA